jgi:3-oxoacyl-[acyl-carrier-protein] synthase-3
VLRAQIAATAAYLPGPAIDNARIRALAGPLPDEILEGLEVRTRHWIVDPDSGEHHDSTTGMATAAARQALARAGLNPSELDLMVTATSSPDYLLPPMAAFLQESLGLERCALLEIRGGCAAAVEALDVARMYLERGQYRNALVVGSESISPLLVPVYLNRDPELIRMRDRLVLYNFGDGAGAIVLQAVPDGAGIEASAMACIGGHRKPGMQIVGGGTSEPIRKQQQAERMVDLRLDAVESQRFTPAVLEAGLSDLLARAGRPAEDYDLCIVPEGNAGYLVRELEAQGGLSDAWAVLAGRIHENLAEVGATGSAALPLALDHAWRCGRLQPGHRILLLAIETSKWIYAGMALTWTADHA